MLRFPARMLDPRGAAVALVVVSMALAGVGCGGAQGPATGTAEPTQAEVQRGAELAELQQLEAA